MGLGASLAEEMDLRLPSHNVFVRGFLLWATLFAPVLVLGFLLSTGLIDFLLDLDAGLDGIFQIFAIVIFVFFGGLFVLAALWGWWTPRVAIRPKKWNRWQRTAGCVAVNVVGVLLLGIVLLVWGFLDGGGSVDLLENTIRLTGFVLVPALFFGALSGVTSKPRPSYYAFPPAEEPVTPDPPAPRAAGPKRVGRRPTSKATSSPKVPKRR